MARRLCFGWRVAVDVLVPLRTSLPHCCDPRDAGDVLEGLRAPREPPGAGLFWASRSRSKPSGNSEVKNKPAQWFSSNIVLLKTYRFFFFIEVVKNQCENEWRKAHLGLRESFHPAWKEGLLEAPAACHSTHRGGETLREKREFGKKLRKSSPRALLQGNVPTSKVPVLVLSPADRPAPVQRTQNPR